LDLIRIAGIVKFGLVLKLVIPKNVSYNCSSVKSRERWRFFSGLCWKIRPDLDEPLL